ncbi:MAG: hypothetical protein HOQ43_08820 [Glycomyces artemisiae]|uniref:Uncharacterized protein n=1 Tax=Glycomyces artemisiae TaxID=1076443 RepID=A0A850C5W3_9ACTN|nr:hypothetical protein [Glycomyces artemisiae]
MLTIVGLVGMFFAGLGVGLVIDRGADGGESAAAESDSPSEFTTTKVVLEANPLEEAKELCAADSPYVRVGDGGQTLSIDNAGAEETVGATVVELGCILVDLDVPDAVVNHIDSTRALDGYQEDSFGEFEMGWTYHPDDGVNMTITWEP